MRRLVCQRCARTSSPAEASTSKATNTSRPPAAWPNPRRHIPLEVDPPVRPEDDELPVQGRAGGEYAGQRLQLGQSPGQVRPAAGDDPEAPTIGVDDGSEPVPL